MRSPHRGDGAPHLLKLRRIGIDTYQEPVIYMRADCPVCRSEGFESQSRILVATGRNAIIATLNVVHGDLLAPGEAGLSEIAWRKLRAAPGDEAEISHPDPVRSFRHVRARLYGHALGAGQLREVVRDIADNRYSDIQLSAFIAAYTKDSAGADEVAHLTQAMVEAGQRLRWPYPIVADKHCVGGLPGNRTTPVVVAIAASCGIPIPKTSSRAITSPAGTADVMECLAPVDLDLDAMRRVVERESGCVVWGGAAELSPTDDILIRVERALNIDSAAQLVASVLSKKVAAGATHVVIDLPVGPTAKVREGSAAMSLARLFDVVGERSGLTTVVQITDGSQPVGRGIGPALEARDVLAVLEGDPAAPVDLRERAVSLAARLIGIAQSLPAGSARSRALQALDDGRAWRKFQSICEAQGGMREPPSAPHRHVVHAPREGKVLSIDNRRLATLAKLAGAPRAPAAGLELHKAAGESVAPGEPLFTVHAETQGELDYALNYLQPQDDIYAMENTE